MDSVQFKSQETHQAITKSLVESANLHKDLQLDAASWTTSSASGSAAYVFAYLQVDCTLNFPGGPSLDFNGKGMVVGLGATGSLGGQATFNVDPNTLPNLPNVTFEAWGLSVGVGGFQVTWYSNNQYIGHGEFYGTGVSLGTPGGGWGSFTKN